MTAAAWSPGVDLTRAWATPRTGPTVLANVAFGIALLAICGRGFLQGLGLKELAYAVQAVALGVLLLVIVACGTVARSNRVVVVVVAYAFLVVEFLSGIYVTAAKGFSAAWLYVFVMTFFAAAMTITAGNRFRIATVVNAPFWLGLAGVASVAVATAQQVGFLQEAFPGIDTGSMGGLVRPSGMTGSYLHYPLFISLLAFVFMQLWHSRRRKVHLALALLFAAAVVISFSRSGVMILGLGAAAAAVTAKGSGQRVRLVYLGVAASIFLPLVLRDTIYSERILSAVRVDGAGNQVRIDQWAEGLTLFADSPILIGGHTGMITNVTENFGGVSAGVVESGLLQQLVSFGLLGAIAFYAVFFFCVRAVQLAHFWIRAGMIGGILQTFVYQSIEVVPFMALFALLPFISESLAHESEVVPETEPGRPARPPAGAHHLAAA